MRCEEEIIKPHSGLGGVGMSVCVLRLDCRRVEKRGCGDCVGAEAEDIQGGEIDGEPDGRFTLVV